MMPSTGVEKLINIHCIFNPDYVTELDNDFFNEIGNQDRYKMNRAGFISYGKSLKPDITDDNLLFKERQKLKKIAIINRRNEYQKLKLTTNQKKHLSLNY
jgi:hypothetical protein